MMMPTTSCTTQHTQQHPNRIRICASSFSLRMESSLDDDDDNSPPPMPLDDNGDDNSLPPIMTRSEMEQLTVAQLRQQLRLRGEKIGEKKVDLIDRILGLMTFVINFGNVSIRSSTTC
eukprot:CAMPEP_0194369892 /NCGR_PEP_ID=MMETSP0174-20130528/18264_1 /TAXON_ID=216777 /ORGANISM="Proboscia alata, Strain PI-D3" /LENGTH=117 /DNA_ID=CAMNT_0039147125 /DNA_START=1 /DNA_END=354 /DNA_ORIENTATION=+